jgi:hypothetical protein
LGPGVDWRDAGGGIELCGESSLAFAVGVYIPMQYTTPIFLGGFIFVAGGRLSRDKSKQQDEASARMEAETSPARFWPVAISPAARWLGRDCVSGILAMVEEQTKLPSADSRNVCRFTLVSHDAVRGVNRHVGDRRHAPADNGKN